ncbi:MAG: hypothetical protein JWM98_2310 [Thermoleophilia bacterium]|nr:hypothetical protein [Thermoleophilia bacterium]
MCGSMGAPASATVPTPPSLPAPPTAPAGCGSEPGTTTPTVGGGGTSFETSGASVQLDGLRQAVQRLAAILGGTAPPAPAVPDASAPAVRTVQGFVDSFRRTGSADQVTLVQLAEADPARAYPAAIRSVGGRNGDFQKYLARLTPSIPADVRIAVLESGIQSDARQSGTVDQVDLALLADIKAGRIA